MYATAIATSSETLGDWTGAPSFLFGQSESTSLHSALRRHIAENRSIESRLLDRANIQIRIAKIKIAIFIAVKQIAHFCGTASCGTITPERRSSRHCRICCERAAGVASSGW